MPKMKRSTLKDVSLNEISFVGSGDNPEAHVMLLKIKPTIKKADERIVAVSKDYDGDRCALLKSWFKDTECLMVKATTFNEIIEQRELLDVVWDLVWTLEDSIRSIIDDDGVENKSSMLAETIAQFQAAITPLTKGEKAMPKELQKKLEEAEDQVTSLSEENETLKKENDQLKADALIKVDDKGACVTCGTVKEADPIDKSTLPEAVVKQMEDQERINKENSERIEKMEEQERTRTYVAKASTVPTVGAVDDVSKMLKDVAKHDPELADQVFETLKQADARIKEGDLLKEKGGNSDNGDGNSAHDQILAKAEELRKENPNLTAAQAYSTVFDSDAELRKAYYAENRGNDGE